MAPYATDLAPSDPLPDSDDIARYCRPMSLKDGQVTFLSFMNGENPIDISVNRIQFYQDHDESEAIAFIVQEMKAYPLGISNNGVYAMLNVAWAISISAAIGIPVKILYTPKSADSSHCSIIAPDENALYMVASELAKKVNAEDLRSVPR